MCNVDNASDDSVLIVYGGYVMLKWFYKLQIKLINEKKKQSFTPQIIILKNLPRRLVCHVAPLKSASGAQKLID